MKFLNKNVLFLISILVVPLVLTAEPKRSKQGFSNWGDVCKERKSTVVQIFTCRNHLDIFEPFRAPEQSIVSGSGVVISQDGYVLTNYHVVDEASNDEVRKKVGIYAQTCLSGKKRFELQYIGGCPSRDVALLQFTPESFKSYKAITKQEGMPFAELVDSDKIVEAQPIMLLGHPDGEEEVKITVGYVKGRTVTPKGALIQTTAPVNHGDSGGPFFDEQGRVIGLCVAKKVNAECFGYIIPTNNIMLMFDDLEKNKILRPPCWGIAFIPTNESTRAYLKCPEEGVYISDIVDGALAAQAGFKRGDIIVAVDDRPLDASGYLFADWTAEKVSLVDYVNRMAIGSDIKFTYYRAGLPINVTVTSITRNVADVDFFYPCFEAQPDYEIFAGMVVSQLTLNHVALLVAQYGSVEQGLMKYTQEESKLEPRLLITSIFNTSQLHLSRALTRKVNLLSKINGKSVNTIKEFREAVLAGKNEQFFTIETDAGAFIALPLQEVLKEEGVLSDSYHYKQSDLVALLKK